MTSKTEGEPKINKEIEEILESLPPEILMGLVKHTINRTSMTIYVDSNAPDGEMGVRFD